MLFADEAERLRQERDERGSDAESLQQELDEQDWEEQRRKSRSSGINESRRPIRQDQV